MKKETGCRDNLISIVVPCFNESSVIEQFYRELKRVLCSLDDFEHEIVFVDDGSDDDTLVKLNAMAQGDACVRVGSFSRNFGHQVALTAGLDAVVGGAAITMDADLQHPPAMIPAIAVP